MIEGTNLPLPCGVTRDSPLVSRALDRRRASPYDGFRRELGGSLLHLFLLEKVGQCDQLLSRVCSVVRVFLGARLTCQDPLPSMVCAGESGVEENAQA